MEIVQSFMTQNPCFVQARKIDLKGLMLHSVGCPQPKASVFINTWNKPTYKIACVHGFIDANSGDVYQTLPWTTRGWHGGGSSNNNYIGIEMCEPDCIKYVGGSNFVCSDYEKATKMAWTTYNSAVELFAYLCKELKLDPTKKDVILSHAEGFQRGIATNHGDPEHLWKQLRMGITMDSFRLDVYKKLQEMKPVTQQEFNEKMNAWLEERAAQPAGWSQNYMDAAVQQGIIQGDEKGQLKPKSFCTRDEVITMLLRALNK